MVKNRVTFLVFTFMVTLMSFCLEAAVEHSTTPAWRTDYSTVLEEARASGKPVVLFFTGSDWCKWCHRLESEALNTKEFVQNTREKYLFVMVDVPMNFDLSPELDKQNEALQKKFGVTHFPTVVVIDGQEKVLTTTGYRSGGGARYAAYLNNIVNDSVSLK